MNKIDYKILSRELNDIIYTFVIELSHNDIERNSIFKVKITKYNNEMSISYVNTNFVFSSEITTLKRIVLKNLRDNIE